MSASVHAGYTEADIKNKANEQAQRLIDLLQQLDRND